MAKFQVILELEIDGTLEDAEGVASELFELSDGFRRQCRTRGAKAILEAVNETAN